MTNPNSEQDKSTENIVEELIKLGLVSALNKQNVIDVINGKFVSNTREYKIKELITKAYNDEFRTYKGTITIQTLEGIYNLIVSKYKEDAEILYIDVLSQLRVYYSQSKDQVYKFPNYSNSLIHKFFY